MHLMRCLYYWYKLLCECPNMCMCVRYKCNAWMFTPIGFQKSFGNVICNSVISKAYVWLKLSWEPVTKHSDACSCVMTVLVCPAFGWCVFKRIKRKHDKTCNICIYMYIYIYLCTATHQSMSYSREWPVQIHTNNMFPLCVLRIDVNACGNDHAHFQKIMPSFDNLSAG